MAWHNYIKLKKRRKEEFQFFMHDFIDACVDSGFIPLKDVLPSYRWHYRSLLRELLLLIYAFIHKHMPFLISRKRGNLLIAANGSTIEDSLFPYFTGYNVIPMLWDCWPAKWDTMIKDFHLFDIHTVLVTSSQIAERINSRTDVHAIWISEGIKVDLYNKGVALKDRSIDVMDIGRRMPKYENVLSRLQEKGSINKIITSNIHKDGHLDDKHVAYTNEELHQLMSESKIMICFPRCDTNPETAGDIETLTQRYWEAMLSRCVIIGRAPKELTQLIGYKSVIEVDWSNAEGQISYILSNISNFQHLVDHNFQTANKYADWSKRINLIEHNLKYVNTK